jgi:AraC-like DNA-binding protein
MIGAPEDMIETPYGGRIMDALSDVLRAAHLSGGVFLHAEFTAPWCVATQVNSQLCAPFLGPTAHLVPYHYVIEGELHVALAGSGEAQDLRRGDVVLFPRNDMHTMGSDVRLPAVFGGELIRPPESGQGLYSIRHGGGGARTRMICGFLGSASAQENPVITTLPPVIRLKTEETGSAEWIRSTFQYAADELARGHPGSETVLAKLSELLFVEAVRRYLADLPADQTGWLAGLRDPVVARVLALLHGDIAHPWSVDELGRQAGSSRSALAERFGRFIGMAPMQYLAHWRLQVAAQKLKSSSATLAQVAEAIGYESEAAFSRAFKKKFGSAPATWRRN